MHTNRRVAIVTDSVSCLPVELANRYEIQIVPISTIIDSKVYRDGVDINPCEVYRVLATARELPTTSAPSPGAFVQVYKELSERTDSIICITIRSELSMMFDSAIQARQIAQDLFPKVSIQVIDSRMAGGAQGFVALAAARAAAEGKSMGRVCETVMDMIPRVRMTAALDTLYYLARSGRIPLGRIAAWSTSLLKIKPTLVFTEDGINLQGSARTKPRAMDRLVEIMKKQTGGKPVHVNIMHANVLDEAESLREKIKSQFECIELFITDFAPTMGVHAGPGVVAVAYYSD